MAQTTLYQYHKMYDIASLVWEIQDAVHENLEVIYKELATSQLENGAV